MSMLDFDRAQYAQHAQKQWNRVADGWHRWVQGGVSQWAAPITERLFDRIELSQGDRVLDLAAGDGDQSLKALRRVGPTGSVLAIDLSERLLSYARRAAAEAGQTNLETRVMNAENLDGIADESFDAVICRLGLMLFGDCQQALQEWNRVLRPNRQIGVMVFTEPQNTPWLSIPAKIALQHAKMPPPQPGQPGIFGLSAPGALEEALRAGGFQAIQTEVYAAPIQYESTVACVQYIREGAGAIQAVLSSLSQDEQEAAWADIEESLRQFETADGFQAPMEVMIGVGMKQTSASRLKAS